MNNLNVLKDNIEELSNFHQIEILKIIMSDKSNIVNENKNGVFINLINIKENIINKIEVYLEYVVKQEQQLSDIETQKDELSNIYFKDNKEISIT